ncbi:hypothetical protein FOCC_FOCC004212 [Frankliniella occidentalis]|nr:hypothetical protein FOCC_FOCC004212 [Frankliniella occidentalis]
MRDATEARAPLAEAETDAASPPGPAEVNGSGAPVGVAETATPQSGAEEARTKATENATETNAEAAEETEVPKAGNDSEGVEAGKGGKAEADSTTSKADGEERTERESPSANGKTHLPEEETLLKKVVEPLQVVEKFDFWKLSLSEKTAYIRKNITVEPMLAMYTIPSVLSSLATQNLSLEKACRVNLGYSDDICDALTRRETANYTFEESESALPAVIILFVGSWSDRHGCRKPCMLLPIIGEFLTAVGLLVCTYFYYELPIEATTFSEAVFPAMTGGWFVMFMAVFTYIADVTSEVDRTFRIGVVNVFFSIGIPIGMALSGVMYRLIGFYGVFGLSACMYLCSFWYGYKHIKETPKKWSGDGPEPAGLVGFLKDFFEVRYLLETFHTSFKKGANNRRVRVVLLMVVVMLVIGPMHGENTVMYLFVRRQFNWDELDFSLFSTDAVVGRPIQLPPQVRRQRHWDDVLRVEDCGRVRLRVCNHAPLIDMMNGTSFIAMRAIASKLVPSDELGKVNSLFGACEAMMPVVCGPLYSKVYQLTMDTLPGAFFLMGGVITGPAFCIFGWYYYEARKDRRKAQLKEIKGP